jgi:hypothetical protein
MKRTAQSIEENKEKIGAGSDKPKAKRGYNPKSRKNLKPAWKAGESGNPTGLPGTDLAAVAARRFFERNPEVEDFQVPKGFNAYAFSVLADRGYGKLTEKKELTITGELALKLEAARRRTKK